MFRLDLLTRVLEESLGGNAKTLLVVTGSPMLPAVKVLAKIVCLTAKIFAYFSPSVMS